MADHQSTPEIQVEMLSQPRLICTVRAMVSTLAERLGFTQCMCGQIALCVGEALANVINHGYEKNHNRPIWLHVWSNADGDPGIKLIVEDRAKQVDPGSIQSRDLDDIRPGGLGVHIIKTVMDDVRYEKRHDGGMRLTMIKALTPAQCDAEPEHATATEA